jgi:hypothetical protein
MSRDDPQVRLRHMLAYAAEAVTLMRGRSRADLDIDRALGLAVLRCVEIVGEQPAVFLLQFDGVTLFLGLRSLPCAIGSSTAMISWITTSFGARSPRICRR